MDLRFEVVHLAKKALELDKRVVLHTYYEEDPRLDSLRTRENCKIVRPLESVPKALARLADEAKHRIDSDFRIPLSYSNDDPICVPLES